MKWVNGFTKRLRHSSTDAEQKLWYYLRAHRLQGFKFRRQHPIGPYIVDFCCLGQHLVVELDGGHHLDQLAPDLIRTQLLNRYGFKVLRFWDNDVLNHTEPVISAILEALAPLPAENMPAGRGS